MFALMSYAPPPQPPARGGYTPYRITASFSKTRVNLDNSYSLYSFTLANTFLIFFSFLNNYYPSHLHIPCLSIIVHLNL